MIHVCIHNDETFPEVVHQLLFSPLKSLHTLNLNTVCRFLDDPQMLFCVVIIVHESWVLLRTNKGLMNNNHKTERLSWIIQETTHSIKIQGYVNFWAGNFFINSVIILSCGEYMLCEIAYSEQY